MCWPTDQHKTKGYSMNEVPKIKTKDTKDEDPKEIKELKKGKEDAEKAAKKHRKDLESAANREKAHVDQIKHLRSRIQRFERDMARLVEEDKAGG